LEQGRVPGGATNLLNVSVIGYATRKTLD